jgi:hypothetical protein
MSRGNITAMICSVIIAGGLIIAAHISNEQHLTPGQQVQRDYYKQIELFQRDPAAWDAKYGKKVTP